MSSDTIPQLLLQLPLQSPAALAAATTADDEPSAALLEFTNSVTLTPSQKDRIIESYLVSSTAERRVITAMYKQAFRDAQFVQLLVRKANMFTAAQAEQRVLNGTTYHSETDQHARDGNHLGSTNSTNSTRGGKKQQHASTKSTTTTTTTKTRADAADASSAGSRRPRDCTLDDTDDGNDDDALDGQPASSSRNGDGPAAPPHPQPTTTTLQQQLSARCRKLRQQIDDAVRCVVGPGPHAVRLCVVRNQAECDKVNAVFAQQFVYPDAHALKSIVTVPKRVSTRHRVSRTGNYCWFLQYARTGDVACAASVNVLPVNEGFDHDRIVVEVPLFATAAGFKNLGLARLLNAAIHELAINMRAERILISADQSAVPFWATPSMGGYAPLTSQQRGRYRFMYDNMCQQFGDVTLMGWVPPTGSEAIASGLLQAALDRSPMFVLDGPARLPLP